ncbi:MAG: hypothetical protein E7549_02035 [Ruminococcaceae bacterium]|nr:hypothetical protein [Oscillospiraceae bacterium]
MKKILACTLSIILILQFSSCSDVYKEVVLTDVGEYTDMWSLPERMGNNPSVLFPSDVAEETCTFFFCKHSTYHLVGTGWQTVLTMQYDHISFLQEVERLQNLCKNSPLCGETKFFDVPSYASVWNWESCFEYAVINENTKTISYIYLQFIDKEDVVIDTCYVPKGYEEEMSDSQSYSVYWE